MLAAMPFSKDTPMTLSRSRTLCGLLGLAALAAVSLPASAADPLFKPGLWEVVSKPTGPGAAQMQAMMAAMQERMKSMPAADRARAEAGFAKNGVSFNNGAMTAKMCISPAMAQRQQLPMQQRGNCNYQTSPPSGNTLSFTLNCTNPTISSEGSAVFSDSTHYTGTSRTTSSMGPQAGGPAPTMSVESTGRWLGAECGAILPVDNAK